MKPGVTMQQAKASLQPFFHQMLDMEVREKDFATAAPETKKAFLSGCQANRQNSKAGPGYVDSF
jgi:hypothetical protein